MLEGILRIKVNQPFVRNPLKNAILKWPQYCQTFPATDSRPHDVDILQSQSTSRWFFHVQDRVRETIPVNPKI
jgi:hypothetical protein